MSTVSFPFLTALIKHHIEQNEMCVEVDDSRNNDD